MKLSEIIAAYGDDNVQVQKLDDCVLQMDLTKEGSKATFVTPERITLNGFPRLGLIVWFDREKVSEIVEKARK